MLAGHGGAVREPRDVRRLRRDHGTAHLPVRHLSLRRLAARLGPARQPRHPDVPRRERARAAALGALRLVPPRRPAHRAGLRLAGRRRDRDGSRARPARASPARTSIPPGASAPRTASSPASSGRRDRRDRRDARRVRAARRGRRGRDGRGPRRRRRASRDAGRGQGAARRALRTTRPTPVASSARSRSRRSCATRTCCPCGRRRGGRTPLPRDGVRRGRHARRPPRRTARCRWPTSSASRRRSAAPSTRSRPRSSCTAT